MNPWLSIWTQPRKTISHIVEENPNRSLWVLAGIYGFCFFMNLFQAMGLGASMGVIGIFILSIVLGPFWGYINFAIWSWITTWVGKWFRGKGHFKAVRAAYAWSFVPLVVTAVLWLLMLVLFGKNLFLNYPESQAIADSWVTLLFVILIVKVILTIWSLVIYINALAEVQQFSVIRAILNIVVTAVIAVILSILVWVLLLFVMGSMGQGSSTAFILDRTLLEIVGRSGL